MKGIVLTIAFLALAWAIPTHAMTTSTTSGYNAPILKTAMNFSARLENGKVSTQRPKYLALQEFHSELCMIGNLVGLSDLPFY